MIPVTGADLVTGMVVYKTPDDRNPQTLAQVRGSCEKGVHFSSSCYDRIGRWFIKIEVEG